MYAVFFNSIWKNLHLTGNFYTATVCGVCDKYEVWVGVRQNAWATIECEPGWQQTSKSALFWQNQFAGNTWCPILVLEKNLSRPCSLWARARWQKMTNRPIFQGGHPFAYKRWSISGQKPHCIWVPILFLRFEEDMALGSGAKFSSGGNKVFVRKIGTYQSLQTRVERGRRWQALQNQGWEQ